MAGPIKLHCMYTNSFDPMLIRFLSGLRDITDPDITNLDNLGKSLGGLGGGEDLWRFKIDRLCELADPSKNADPVIHLMTDIDLAVYAPLKPVIVQSLENADICFQAEKPDGGEANIGVIAFRPSAKVLYFWNTVRQLILMDRMWDQRAVNIILEQIPEARFEDIRISLFPKTVWAYSQTRDAAFANCPQVVLHHANCVNDLPGKWEQLNEFAEYFRKDRLNHDYALNEVKQKIALLNWHFGNLANPVPYGSLRVDTDGNVQGYEHRNEARLLTAAHGIYFTSQNGECTTFFNEFYYDPFRGKLLCVGKVLGNERLFHYLLAAAR